jgi:uncharacterized protein YcbK (DUF882 family)
MQAFGSWARRSLVGPVTAALIAPLAASEIAEEPARPTSSMGLSFRKEQPIEQQDSAESALVSTLGTLFNTHSGEAVALSKTEPTAERFASLVEDRVTGSRETMSPALLELLRALAEERAPARIDIVSGYRSWKLNEHLRKKGRRVASHSQHSLGNAMDFRIEGMSAKHLRLAIEASGWNGGIGYYPGAADRFVHADAGPKRTWIGH